VAAFIGVVLILLPGAAFFACGCVAQLAKAAENVRVRFCGGGGICGHSPSPAGERPPCLGPAVPLRIGLRPMAGDRAASIPRHPAVHLYSSAQAGSVTTSSPVITLQAPRCVRRVCSALAFLLLPAAPRLFLPRHILR